MLTGDAETVEKFAEELERYQATVLPQAFPVVLGILAVLCFAGIVWPRAYLPGFPGNSKFWMLLLFSLGFSDRPTFVHQGTGSEWRGLDIARRVRAHCEAVPR